MHIGACQPHSLRWEPRPSLALSLFHISKLSFNGPWSPELSLHYLPLLTCIKNRFLYLSRLLLLLTQPWTPALSPLSPRTLWPPPSQWKYIVLWTKERLPVLSATQQGPQSRRTRAQTVSGGEESMVMPQSLTLGSVTSAQHKRTQETWAERLFSSSVWLLSF